MITIEPAVSLANYFLDVGSLKLGDAVVRDGDEWLCFTSPSSVVTTVVKDEVERVMALAEAHVVRGGWAAGFVAYEAGSAFDRAILSGQDGKPLVWFGLYDREPDRFRELAPVYASVPVELLELDTSESAYKQAFAVVKDALEAGKSYQLNLTMRQRFRLSTSAARFFSARCGVNAPPYAAFINGGAWQVASFSPELFFERKDADIESRPMKGTVLRPTGRAQEQVSANALVADPKSVAENIMIVDMVRSDLGAVAEPGSVHVPELLRVERHRGLLQMTSTVRAKTRAPTREIFRHLFPPASVTGAPKVSTCGLIHELEDSPRGVYCGAIGFMAPGRQRFSVGIRTAWIDAESGEGEFGIGSGIVWDSEPEAEYAECLAKRDFLLHAGEQWGLLEAIPLQALGDDSVVSRHLRRLSTSAAVFGIEFDASALRTALAQLPHTGASEHRKVRVKLLRDGTFDITTGPSSVGDGQLTATLASTPIDSTNPNFRFKTTSRGIYQRHLDAQPDFDEVLLYNERGEVTEFCRGNVVLRLADRLITPDPAVGCLPGTGVARLVERGEVAFARPTVDDLSAPEALYFVNAVVGLIPVSLSLSVARLRESSQPSEER